MSNMHQLWVSVNVYRQDEGGFPVALYGFAEAETATGQRLPWDPALGLPVVPADNTHLGLLYREQTKDLNIFRCPDSNRKNKSEVVTAYFPPRPVEWPNQANGLPAQYIGDYLAANGCPTAGQLGTLNCHWELPSKAPYYYYAVDAYDISPAIDPATGAQILDSSGAIGYHVRYSRDWTGNHPAGGPNVGTGSWDLPFQLKYENPPDDRTLLTFCSWHQAVAHTGTVPAITMGGSAKKINLNQALRKLASLFAG
jgi:hypothetical protein